MNRTAASIVVLIMMIGSAFALSCATHYNSAKGDALGVTPSQAANDPRLQETAVYIPYVSHAENPQRPNGTCEIISATSPVHQPCDNITIEFLSMNGSVLGNVVSENGEFTYKPTEASFRINVKLKKYRLKNPKQVFQSHQPIKLVLVSQ